MPACWSLEKATADFYETCGEGPRPEARRQLGDRRAVRGAEPHRQINRGARLSRQNDLGELIDLIADSTVSGRLAKDVFARDVRDRQARRHNRGGEGAAPDDRYGAIEAAIEKVMAEQCSKVAEYRSGKEKLFGFFVGQVMRATGGKANPALLNELLRKKLAG